jgi:hypothetical protein
MQNPLTGFFDQVDLPNFPDALYVEGAGIDIVCLFLKR